MVTATTLFTLVAQTHWSTGHLVLLLMAAACLLGAAWSHWRRRTSNPPHELNQRPQSSPRLKTSGPSVTATPPESAAAGLDATSDASTDDDLLFSSPSSLSTRQCPDCQRTFPAAFDACPFDDATLETSTDKKAQKDGFGDGILRRYCPDCGRRYEGDARHCTWDGRRLRRDSETTRDQAPAFKLCTHCGWQRSATSAKNCPRDDHPLITIRPADTPDVLLAPLPFQRCRRCGYTGPPGETICPTDGTILLPASSIVARALPSTGCGPRRRICTDCGARFDDQCRYCSHDGTRLMDLH